MNLFLDYQKKFLAALKKVKEKQLIDYPDNFYSFVGASQQSAIIKTHAPKWAEMLKSHNVDAVLLVAA